MVILKLGPVKSGEISFSLVQPNTFFADPSKPIDSANVLYKIDEARYFVVGKAYLVPFTAGPDWSILPLQVD